MTCPTCGERYEIIPASELDAFKRARGWFHTGTAYCDTCKTGRPYFSGVSLAPDLVAEPEGVAPA